MPDAKKQNVGCYRRCKRYLRKKIKWNGLRMRVQLRIHLFSLFGIFFVLYFTFIFIYTQFAYVSELESTVDD